MENCKLDLFGGFFDSYNRFMSGVRVLKLRDTILAVLAVFTILLVFQIYQGNNNQAFAEEYFVAGEAPSQRPANAPLVKEVGKFAPWHLQPLHGVNEPVPEHIKNFVKDQGNWFNPFFYAGMSGPYDIRGWHKEN